jgi:two-component system cell cycle sensor histidine kinase/response regulator CckA
MTEIEDEVLTLSVSDQGTGIPIEARSQIFKPFFRTKRGSKNGLGLGLSISKGIVEKLGGQINFESETGKGTVFRVILPIRIGGKVTGHG